MRFYKITSAVKGFEEGLLEEGERVILERYGSNDNLRFQLKTHTEDFNTETAGCFIAVSELSEKEVVACLLAQDELDPVKLGRDYFASVGIKGGRVKVTELTFSGYQYLLRKSDCCDVIHDEDIVLKRFNLYRLARSGSSVNFEEGLLVPLSNKSMDALCRRLQTSNDLKQELTRIRASRGIGGVEGHPVHYVVKTSDEETRTQTSSILLGSLMKSGRLNARRFCTVALSENLRPSRSSIEDLFAMNKGGVILIDIVKEFDSESGRADETFETIDKICACARIFRNNVLTVWRLPMNCAQVRSYLFERMGVMSFVELGEEAARVSRAKRLLTHFARERNLEPDDRLFEKLEESEMYLTAELRVMFEEWQSKKLKTDVYPQYASFETVGATEIQRDSRGNAHEELMSLVGLADAKRVINCAIDFHRIQKFLLSKDVVRERPSYHMLFTGNPGSAKTTVARLFGRIMRENELLESGHIVEVGRADLVGKYVGHTAPLVQKCFERAKGGVLFIDEAYSLVDDRDGCFGDEAINTIVQEMENHRDSMVVIFAGYPDKMQQFLQKNPGLSSRISFHVAFPDYDTEELCEIASLISKKKGLRLSADAQEKLAELFNAVRAESDFGNGRYVRSIIERAMMAQATRLASGDLSQLKKSDYTTLVAEDIEMPKKVPATRRQIGFCA